MATHEICPECGCTPDAPCIVYGRDCRSLDVAAVAAVDGACAACHNRAYRKLGARLRSMSKPVRMPADFFERAGRAKPQGRAVAAKSECA